MGRFYPEVGIAQTAQIVRPLVADQVTPASPEFFSCGPASSSADPAFARRVSAPPSSAALWRGRLARAAYAPRTRRFRAAYVPLIVRYVPLRGDLYSRSSEPSHLIWHVAARAPPWPPYARRSRAAYVPLRAAYVPPTCRLLFATCRYVPRQKTLGSQLLGAGT